VPGTLETTLFSTPAGSTRNPEVWTGLDYGSEGWGFESLRAR
jgi:hypothetical protein